MGSDFSIPTLAIEGGATHARAGLYLADGSLSAEAESGPANPVAYGVEATADTLTALAKRLLPEGFPPPLVCAGLAGAADAATRRALAELIGRQLGARRTLITTDLHPLLAANAGPGPGVLAIAGTGSGVLAKNLRGRMLRIGARGAVFGDEGSAYRLAVEGLRAAAAMADGLGPDTEMHALLTAAAGLANFEQLPEWSAKADKRAVAALARVVTDAAEAGDFVAAACVEEQARRLAAQVVAAGERLNLDEGYRVFMHGSLLVECALFQKAFRQSVDQYAEAQFMACARTGHAAVAAWAGEIGSVPEWATEWTPEGETAEILPVTERRRDEGPFLDELDATGIVQLMNRLDANISRAVALCADDIARAVDACAGALRADGRIIYTGAGTSGRLGVLDASECPPTFGVSPDRVVGIMAGGDRALRESVEGEEDDCDAGASGLAALCPGPNDVVAGIAASGSTPYVAGALALAKERGAATVLVCCNPSPSITADIIIAVNTGPEALAGSTRLKAGTATKMVLNMISTGAMALAGYVHRGLMVEMRPTNAKLRRRAARIVAALAGVGEETACRHLEDSGWSIPVAVLTAAGKMPVTTAESTLEAVGGRLPGALKRLNLE